MAKKRTRSSKKSFNWALYGAVTFIALLILPIIVIVSSSQKNLHSEAAMINPVGQTGNWNMIFADEFEGTTLDETKWIKCREWGQKDKPCESTTTPKMTYRPENVIVENGLLRLRAQKGAFVGSTGKTYEYSSGLVSTAKYYNDTNPIRFQHKYGYMEARIKVPKGQGLWPAFWNVASNGQWPPEIDIMENLTGPTHDTYDHLMHYHYKDNTGTHRDSGATWRSPVDLASDYHVYGVSWEPNAIRWYLDGVERRSAFVESQYISAQDMFLILNLQVGGDWPGDPNTTTPFPSTMDVDYVRVWQRATTEPSPTNVTVPTNIIVPTTVPTLTVAPSITPVSTDTTPPSVTITYPSQNASIARGTRMTITANASDASGIQRVEFYVNGSLKCTDVNAEYNCLWRMPNAKGSTYTLTTKAVDMKGNTAFSPTVQVTSR